MFLNSRAGYDSTAGEWDECPLNVNAERLELGSVVMPYITSPSPVSQPELTTLVNVPYNHLLDQELLIAHCLVLQWHGIHAWCWTGPAGPFPVSRIQVKRAADCSLRHQEKRVLTPLIPCMMMTLTTSWLNILNQWKFTWLSNFW
ncbi:hypothetical protein V6N13_144373 [Hibiscus sabdariffa]|uniref:Uncharacterized protein n=1 Tax=Hibiscus sabdariffa TaxID=183260 RepID=A0ABR2FK65_9ROSI